MTESWLPVPGYVGSYEVSNQGRVRSIPRLLTTATGVTRPAKGHVLKPCPTPSGHLRVNLGRANPWLVHQLVARAFHGEPKEGQEVRHLDDNPANNTPGNLAWGTRSENVRDRVRNGIHHVANKTHCPQGHLLVAANTTACGAREGYRRCLACNRARSLMLSPKHAHKDFQTLADSYYEDIMKAVAA
ncbi:NUMOD4 motif-containing HNH endonuclease [Nocardia sp. NPDC056611]|uniref:NUMOD4 motif-containing HNH endonuclease n=1 Tax=Nocardia sp. NPDC056611 TaxID=3345877 RepID=UPI003671D390